MDDSDDLAVHNGLVHDIGIDILIVLSDEVGDEHFKHILLLGSHQYIDKHDYYLLVGFSELFVIQVFREDLDQLLQNGVWVFGKRARRMGLQVICNVCQDSQAQQLDIFIFVP